MRCQHCGQQSDWVGDRSDWQSVNGRTATRGLYECAVCGNRQFNR